MLSDRLVRTIEQHKAIYYTLSAHVRAARHKKGKRAVKRAP
jgi:hypothetical protein